MQMVRYCPDCDDEFRPEILVCSDCGGALILQEEGLGANAPKPTSEGDDGDARPSGAWRTALDAVPFSSLLPVRTFDALRELEPAVSAFAAAELPSRVLVQNGRYILLIRPDDLTRAQKALPTADQVSNGGDDGHHESFDAHAGRYSHCPACGSQLPDGFDGACPECGLELSTPSGTVQVPEAE